MKLEQTLRSNHLQPCSARLLLWLLGLGVVAGQVRAQETFTWEQLRDKFKQTNPTLLSDAVNIDESRAEEITAEPEPRAVRRSVHGFQNAQYALSPTIRGRRRRHHQLPA